MKKLIFSTLVLATGLAFAEDGTLDRPSGIKIGDRLTLRPYVSFSYTFDTNPDTNTDGDNDASYWTANPGIDFDYVGNNWKLTGLAYYMYHAFSSGNESSLNNDSYGEQLGYYWTNIENGGAGWRLEISERYVRINQNDDFGNGDGRGLWRDRQQFDASAVLQRRFNEHWHASVNSSYYWLDYVNDPNSYATLYSWSRWSTGIQIGYTASPWTDLFVAGSYQYYTQDGGTSGYQSIGGDSQGWTAHIGIGSFMTERIEYSLSAGVSTFKYGDGADSANGFTYQGSLRWRIGDTWMTSLLINSYYHPSERELGSAVRCDSISWGVAKSLVSGKLNATFDVAYRHDSNEYTNGGNWDLNLLTARLGLNYTVNRIITLFARGEFQQEINRGDEVSGNYDYDRWRATLGVKFTY